MHRQARLFHREVVAIIPGLSRGPCTASAQFSGRLFTGIRIMDAADKMACAELVQAWGFARDQARWDDLTAIFHADGQIHVSWFKGAYADFVERCRQNHGRARAKHLLWPARVAVSGDRALSECNVAILVRQAIEGIECDLTSYARFIDRIERRDGRWRIADRVTIYEQDRLDPVLPSAAFDKMMQGADAARYPAAYRYMGYRVVAAGRALAEPVHYDGRAETEALKASNAEWIAGR
jgi:hypothetical protein